MSTYHTFIGIDIGKFNFVVATHGQSQAKEYEYSLKGMESFLKDHEDILSDSLCIIETTGGYELKLIYTLMSKGYRVHRANTRKVKNFIRSYGNEAKTDKLDALSLARYGFERHATLELYAPQSKEALALYELVGRRTDLKKLLVAEKNRLQGPCTNLTRPSIQAMIKTLEVQIQEITCQMELLVKSDERLQQKKEVLKTIPGIGDITAMELLALLPELGSIDRRAIASLAGLAPRSNDSGLHQGYRRVSYGRTGVKPALFMAAMAARRSKSHLGAYYEAMIGRGKKKMVSLIALMRKLVVIANARLRDFEIQNPA